MSDLYRDEESGILLVYSDPGETSTLEEFQDWYDNEHVPLRTLRFTEFRSAGRYEVYESKHAGSEAKTFKAGWAAAYTISSNGLYNNPAYSGLRTNRSPREAELVARLGVLDRRIFSLVADSAALSEAKGDLTAKRQSDVEKEASAVEHIGFDLPESTDTARAQQWFSDEVLPSLQGIKGATRVRLVRLCDAIVNGKWAAKENGDAKAVAKWAVITGECMLGGDAGQVEIARSRDGWTLC